MVPVYRFYTEKNANHFYTASEEESALVKAKYPGIYVFEGIAYWTLADAMELGPTAVIASVPLYRFYNKTTGSHFYTISEAEKAFVMAKYGAVFTYEGPTYNVFNDAIDAPVMPVHRFYNKKNGSHFYTISDTEKVYVRLHYAQDYTYEGVAFYAIPSDLWFIR